MALRFVERPRSALQRPGYSRNPIRDLSLLFFEQRFGRRSGSVQEFCDNTPVVFSLPIRR
jgi:hypothetical protein